MRGGGYSLNAASDDVAASEGAEGGKNTAEAAENPYTTEYFDAAAKAPGVTGISIPATVAQIDPAFFQQFPGATQINVAAENPIYQSHNGMLFGVNEAAEATSLLLVPEGMEGAAVLPLTLATVPACVLTRCHKLSAVVFPNGGTGSNSLATRDGILYTADLSTLLAAPAGLGASAALAPETRVIAQGAFWGNDALDTLVVNGNVEGIEDDAFAQQTIANATVALAGDYAKDAWQAAGFTRFSEPAQPGAEITPAEGSGFTFTLLDDYTLAVAWAGDDPAPAALRIPAYGMLDGVQYTVSAVAEDGFAGQQSIVTVDMPDTITTVGARAFEGCDHLQTVDFVNAIDRIGARAFAGTALLSAVLPANLETIGAEAFGGLTGTTVVALGNAGLVSDAAFAGSTGLSVYVPYREDGAYAIGAGLPASGNHVYPYGVKMASDAAQLEEGETAELFADGYLEAPGQVQVDYAYKARPISVDTEAGTVEAKQVGSSDVQVSLTLKVPTAYVKSIAADQVRLKKASFGDATEEGAAAGLGEVFEGEQTINLASAASAYSVAPDAGIATVADTGIQYQTDDFNFYKSSDGLGYAVEVRNKATLVNANVPRKVNGYYVIETVARSFSGCPQLETVTLPETVTFIHTSGAFDNSPKLTAINVSPANPNYHSVDGVLYSKNSQGDPILCRVPEGAPISNLTIEQGTVEIGDTAIYMNPNITAVSIPSSVKTIQANFLSYCTSLTSIVIPNTVTTANLNPSLKGCSALQSVTFGTGVKSLVGVIDAGCGAITEINVMGTIPENKINTANWTMNKSKCTVTLPAGASETPWAGFVIHRLGDGLWYTQKDDGTLEVYGRDHDSPGEAGLLNGAIVIPETWEGIDHVTGEQIKGTVTSIGVRAFAYSTGLTSIVIPKTVTYIYTGTAFDASPKLEWIEVDPDNPNYMSEDGALYSKKADGSVGDFLRYPTAAKAAVLTIKDGVEYIGNTAIYQVNNLTSVYVPDSVTLIDAWFCTGCPNLTEVRISPNATLAEGDRSFLADCKSLESITLGAKMASLGTRAFAGSTSLKSITISGKVVFGSDSFASLDTSQCTVYVPYGVDSSNWSAAGFKIASSSSGLRFVQNGAGEVRVQGSDTVDYAGKDLVGYIVVPETWSGAEYKTGTHISGTVTAFEGRAFYNAPNLTGLFIPKTVKSVNPSGCFDSSLKLESIDVDTENPVYESRNGVLYSKKGEGGSWQMLRYPSGKKDSVFIVPEGVTEIANTGIYQQQYVKSIVIPSTVTTIRNYIGTGSPLLESLTIPDSVTTFESGSSLQGCPSLKTVTLGTGVTSISAGFLKGSSNVTDIYVRGNTLLTSTDVLNGKDGNSSCTVHLPSTASAEVKKSWKDAGFTVTDESFSISFDSNGGSFMIGDDRVDSYGSIAFAFGLPISAPEYTPSRTGYTLVGWYENAEGTGSAWDFGSSRLTQNNLVLYAKWQAVPYTVNLNGTVHPDFVDAGGTAIAKQWQVAFEKSSGVHGPDFTLPVAKFRGYTLEGWYTSYDDATGTFSGKKFADGAAFNIKEYVPGYGNDAYVDGNDAYISDTNSITLYAKWVEKTYTVHFRNAPDAADLSTVKANYETTSTAAGGSASTATIKLSGQFAATSDGQYYTQWGTRVSGAAADGNLVEDAAANVSMKVIIDGYSDSVNYVDVPSGSTIYDITDVYFYPQWQYIKYTVTYGQNVSSTGKPAAGKPGAEATLPSTKTEITYRADGLYLNGVKQENGIDLGKPTNFGEGYGFASWATSATSSGLSNTLTTSNFTDFFSLKYGSTDNRKARSLNVVPLWNEFTYNVTLYNTDAAGTATSETSAVASSVAYHESVQLAVPGSFTVPNGKKAGTWRVDSAASTATMGVNTGSAKTSIASIVAKTAEANKGSASAAANLNLYLSWVNRNDLKYTVYYVYEDEGAYPANATDTSLDNVSSRDYTPVMNESKIGLQDADKEALAGFVFDEQMSNWKNDPAHGGYDTVQGNDSVLYAYFKKLYTVEFNVGMGGDSSVDGGKVSNTYTYTHNNGSNAGTPAKMSEAMADLAEVADFETPAAGNYFDGYLFSGDYEATTSQDANADTFSLDANGDIDDDASYTAVFKAIEYRINYKHAYASDLGMSGSPDDSTLAAKSFEYADLADGATVGMTNAANTLTVPVGFKQTGWVKSDDSHVSYDVDGQVALAGDAGDTFAALGFKTTPNEAHKHWQDVTLDATWDYREYTVKFWKFTDKAEKSKVTVQGGAFDTATFDLGDTDGFTLPDQNGASGDADHPYIADTQFGYALTSWSMVATPTGEIPESAESLLPAGKHTTLSQLLFGRKGGLASVATEPADGVINLYATWTPVYSIAVPSGAEIVNFDVDLATGEVSDPVEAKVESRTPRTVTVDAYAEVVADDTHDSPLAESAAAKLFVQGAAEGTADENDVANALSDIQLKVSGESSADKRLSICGDASSTEQVIDSIAPASPDNLTTATPKVSLVLPTGQWINPSLKEAEAPDENATIFKRWGEIARIVWIVSDAGRDVGQHLYPSEAQAYPTE